MIDWVVVDVEYGFVVNNGRTLAIPRWTPSAGAV